MLFSKIVTQSLHPRCEGYVTVLSPIDHKSFVPNPITSLIHESYCLALSQTRLWPRITLLPFQQGHSLLLGNADGGKSHSVWGLHTKLLPHPRSSKTPCHRVEDNAMAPLPLSDTTSVSVDYRARKRSPQCPVVGGMLHMEAPPYPLLLLRKEVSLFLSHIGLISGKEKFERSDCRRR